MHEILFRGKLKFDNGEHKKGDWAFGDLVRIKDGEKTSTMIYGFGEVDPSTVGQYTGLTDKYGKKIFEGDIVNFKTTAYYFKNCRIKYQSYYGRYCDIDNHGYEYPMDKTFEYEVIGNIHDNPELMKGASQ